MISEDHAHRLVDPHIHLLRDCLETGWSAWEDLGSVAAGIRRPITASGRARLVHDHCIHRAEQLFGLQRVAGVRAVRVRGLYMLDFNGELLVRFKKFTSATLGTAGIPTQQRLRFEAQGSLPGTPPDATKAVAGYVLNYAQTEILALALTCSSRGVTHWTIDISRKLAVVVPVPASGVPAATQTLETEVRSALQKRQEEDSGEGE